MSCILKSTLYNFLRSVESCTNQQYNSISVFLPVAHHWNRDLKVSSLTKTIFCRDAQDSSARKRGHTQARHTSHAGRIPIGLLPLRILRRGPSARSCAHQVRHACAPGAIHVHVASTPRLRMKPFSLTATKVFSDIFLLFLPKRRLWRSDECEGILQLDSRNITLGGGKVMCMR